MPPVDLPVEILFEVIKSIPLGSPREFATLALVNKTFFKFAEKRLYCHLQMDLRDPTRLIRAVKCLRTLAGRRSAAEAVRSISVSWDERMGQAFQCLLVESLEHTTGLLTLSLANRPTRSSGTTTFFPLFPKTLPLNFLPKLSILEADTQHTVIQLVPYRPVHTVSIQARGIDAGLIRFVVDALHLSTIPIQHLHFKIAVSGPKEILPTLMKIVMPEKLPNLVTLDLQWECHSPSKLDRVID